MLVGMKRGTDQGSQKQFLMGNVPKSFSQWTGMHQLKLPLPYFAIELGNYWGLTETTVPSAAANKTDLWPSWAETQRWRREQPNPHLYLSSVTTSPPIFSQSNNHIKDPLVASHMGKRQEGGCVCACVLTLWRKRGSLGKQLSTQLLRSQGNLLTS